MKVLITGCAGFIGCALTEYLLKQNVEVVGIDSINDYYDVRLKEYRLERIKKYNNLTFYKIDIANQEEMVSVFEKHTFDVVINLAAQAGVRYSIENPHVYAISNLIGMTNILECCRQYDVEHLIYASSSSVYGKNTKIPFTESDRTDFPVSFYAATKKSNEVMATSYSNLYGLRVTGLRFFTVYGPAGRPDMAPWLFTRAILTGKEIDVFNKGDMYRDFTYIEDIVAGIVNAIEIKMESKDNIYNLGNDTPEKLGDFIEIIERICEKPARKNYKEMQLGDVKRTWANIDKARTELNYTPRTTLEDGLEKFISWYTDNVEIFG